MQHCEGKKYTKTLKNITFNAYFVAHVH